MEIFREIGYLEYNKKQSNKLNLVYNPKDSRFSAFWSIMLLAKPSNQLIL